MNKFIRSLMVVMVCLVLLSSPNQVFAGKYDEPYYSANIEAQKYIKNYEPKRVTPTKTSEIYSSEVITLVEQETQKAFFEWANSTHTEVFSPQISYMIVKPVTGSVDDQTLNIYYQKMLQCSANNGMYPAVTYSMVAYVQYTGVDKKGDKVSNFAYFFLGSADGGKTVSYTEPGWPVLSQYTQTAYIASNYSSADPLVFLYTMKKK